MVDTHKCKIPAKIHDYSYIHRIIMQYTLHVRTHNEIMMWHDVYIYNLKSNNYN